ncbi:MAG: efflux transporter outer membrane subunit [Pseudomonadota bacterium]
MIRRHANAITGALAALVTLTSGCAALRAPDEPVTHERHDAPLQDSSVPLNSEAQWPTLTWWRDYGDDTLNTLIDQALHDSPGMSAAAARFATASENARVTGAQSGLQVDSFAKYELYRLSDNGLIPPEFLGYHWVNQSDLGISATYTFDWWGRNRSLIESATNQARASEAEQQGVALTLAANIAQSYFGWQLEGARIALLDEQLATLQQAALITQHREAAGLDRSDDGDRNRRDQAAVRELRTQLQGAQKVRVIEIAALLGTSPDHVNSLLQAHMLPKARAGLPANASIDLIAHRPDIAASRWRVEAARKDVASIRAEYYPDVSIHALAALSSVDFIKLLDPGSWAPSTGFAVHLPLFDAGLRGARHDEASARLAAAVARYNETIVDAAREVGTAASKLTQSSAQRVERANQVQAAQSLLRSARARQQSGVTDLRPELDASISLQRELDASLQVDYSILVADIQLQAALGGGLTTTETSP